MKKKIVALCLVLALAVTAIAGATMAYFTDAEAKLNTFTFGNVSIDLVEEFQQNSQLMPGKENAVAKTAKIKNDGVNEAWVWAEVLVPAALDDADDNSPQAPGLGNSLHFNFPAESTKEWGNGKWEIMHNEDGLSHGFAGTETVDGVVYNKFVYLHEGTLAANAETDLFLSQVYMDAKCTQCTEGHDDCMILMDGETHYASAWNLIVRAFAIQDADFENVVAAWKAYDGVKAPVAVTE